MFENFAKVNQLNIFYRIFKNGIEVKDVDPNQKTMIVIHGGIGLVDHQIEVEAWKDFSNILQVIFLDQRGCGRTQGGTLDEWSLEQCADDLYEFCQTLKINRPILAGISFGGFVIMSCVARHPDFPYTIIFANTEAKKIPEARYKVLMRIANADAADAASDFDQNPSSIEKAQKFFETCVPYFSKTPFTLMPGAKEDWDLWAKSAVTWATFDCNDGLKKNINCPVLILAGVDDPNHPLESSTELAQSIPKKFRHFYPIANAGAPVYQDQPHVFKELVTNFLTQIL